MDFLLIAIGSAGDVHPFVGLGKKLTSRGHHVALATNGYFRELVSKAGLEFIELPGPLMSEVLEDPNLWHPLWGFETVARKGILPLIRPVYDLVRERHQRHGSIVVAASLALGARVAQDRWKIPTATLHLQPVAFRSTRESPKLPGLMLGPSVPPFFKRLQYALADRLMVDRLLAPPVNALRKELGLSRTRGIVADYWHSPDLTLGMFPDWFSAPQPDWPRQATLTGFPLYDEADVSPPGADLVEFLARNDKPIAFTPGSANVHGREFFQAAIEACALLGRSCLLLTRFPEQVPRNLPEHARHVDFAPFSWLLPRVAALVHHGGIGSMSQAMAAGIPQLIMPMSHDQPDNAARVRRLGVGDFLSRRAFRAPQVAEFLKKLLESPQVRTSVQEVARRFQGVDGLGVASLAIEKLAA